MKIVIFSDTHVTADEELAGRLPERHFAAALEHVRLHHADADHLILLGDITHNGRAAEYRRLQALLAECPLPFSLMMGNHDDRVNFRDVFGGDGLVQQTVTVGNHPCYLLDTLVPGDVGGRLDEERLTWLDEEIARQTEPGFVFLHHPPITTGLPAFDAHKIPQSDAFQALLQKHRQHVKAVFFGHCHMSLSGSVGSIPAFCIRSTLVQSAPVFGSDRYATAPDHPAGYGLVIADGNGFVLHHIDVP